MTSTNHPLFQQPYKYIDFFGQVQPRVVQLLIFISSQMDKNPAILVIFGKEMWSRGEGVRIFCIVSLALRLLYEKVFRGK